MKSEEVATIKSHIRDINLNLLTNEYNIKYDISKRYGIWQRFKKNWELIKYVTEIGGVLTGSRALNCFIIHITVDTSENFFECDIDGFKSKCQEFGVKPIILDLEIKEGTLKDVMTSSKHFGDNRSAYEEANRIANELTSSGYKVVRKKIETHL